MGRCTQTTQPPAKPCLSAPAQGMVSITDPEAGGRPGPGAEAVAAERSVLHQLWPQGSTRAEQWLLSSPCQTHLPSGPSIAQQVEGSFLFSRQVLTAQLPLPESSKISQSFLDPGPTIPLAQGTKQPQGQSPCQVGAVPAAGQQRQ